MKRLLLSMVALVGAVSMNAQDDLDSLLSVELQNVQVVSTRASKKTPMAYTNMDREALKAVQLRPSRSTGPNGCGMPLPPIIWRRASTVPTP